MSPSRTSSATKFGDSSKRRKATSDRRKRTTKPCFVAIERSTKLVLNFALGRRSKATTDIFIEGLRQATSSQSFQITTDGFAPYVKAISDTLADRVDFAQLIKVYRSSTDGGGRYS